MRAFSHGSIDDGSSVHLSQCSYEVAARADDALPARRSAAGFSSAEESAALASSARFSAGVGTSRAKEAAASQTALVGCPGINGPVPLPVWMSCERALSPFTQTSA